MLFGNDEPLPKRAAAQHDAAAAQPSRFLRFAPVIQGACIRLSGGRLPKGHCRENEANS